MNDIFAEEDMVFDDDGRHATRAAVDYRQFDRNVLFPGYIIISRQTAQTRERCFNRCVEKLSDSDAIHNILYLPAAESRYSADKINGTYCRKVPDFRNVVDQSNQEFYEFWMTYDQYEKMVLYLNAHAKEGYDQRMSQCGWWSFFCSDAFMEQCCTTEKTQTCSRYIMHALIAAGIARGPPEYFVFPAEVLFEIESHPLVFQRVQWQQMVDNVNAWFDRTGVPRRAVHIVHDAPILKTYSSVQKERSKSPPPRAKAKRSGSGVTAPLGFRPLPTEDEESDGERDRERYSHDYEDEDEEEFDGEGFYMYSEAV